MHSKSYFAEHATDQKVRERYFPDLDRRGVMVEVGGEGRQNFCRCQSISRTMVGEP